MIEKGIEKSIEKIIENIDFTSANGLIIVLLSFGIFVGPILMSIGQPSIEKIFTNPKDKQKNMGIGMIILVIVLAVVNVIIINDETIMNVIAVAIIVIAVGTLHFYKKGEQTKQFIGEIEGIEKLSQYYKEISAIGVLLFILCLVPFYMYRIGEQLELVKVIAKFGFAIIVSIIELVIICLCDLRELKRISTNYFFHDGKKMYIYERVDNDMILCGDKPIKNDAKKYIIIKYEDLKTIKINHYIYKKVPKNKIKELKLRYRRRRNNMNEQENIRNQ